MRRWAVPDRIFFGYSAGHILAGVYLKNPPLPGFFAERIIPGDGFSGNHIYVTNGELAFDYRGYTKRARLLIHHRRDWARQYDSGWNCILEQPDFDLLTQERSINAICAGLINITVILSAAPRRSSLRQITPGWQRKRGQSSESAIADSMRRNPFIPSVPCNARQS